MVADVDEDAARTTARELSASGGAVEAEALDVTDVEAVRRIFGRWDRQAPLETVVNNAGIAFSQPLTDVEVDRFDRLLAVNVRGVFFATQAAARIMAPRGRGSIVNMASTSGFRTSTVPMAPYDLSKAAVRMLTVSAAHELAGCGVRVNAVAPGTMDTDMTRSLAVSDDALERLAAKRVPLGRLGRPDEIAAAVEWLSSADASYVTGHVLVVDGGWLT